MSKDDELTTESIEAEERIQTKLAEYDAYYNLLFLLNAVNEFEPREKWIVPILESTTCQDFKNQLITVIEDYEGQTSI